MPYVTIRYDRQRISLKWPLEYTCTEKKVCLSLFSLGPKEVISIWQNPQHATEPSEKAACY